MTKIWGLLHYEHLPSRGKGHEWRVGDQDDDFVADFPTEAEASAFVRAHNESIGPNPKAWRF